MRNLTMMTDLYQLTMMYGYYKFGMTKNQAVFDVFFRALTNRAWVLSVRSAENSPTW